MRGSRPGLCLALVAVGALGLAACGGDDDDASPASSSSSSTTSTTTGPAACPIDPLGEPLDATTASADVDGDGEADDITAHRATDGWHVRVDLASGGGADGALSTAGAEGAALIGGADAGGDAAEEIWLQTGSGASARILGLFRFRDCAVVPVTVNGAVAELPVGASVVNTSGVACEDGAVVIRSGTSSDGRTYEVTAEQYRLDGDELTSVDSETSTVASGSPEFVALASFRCGDLSL
jgi:hypothetical protein